MNKIVSMDSVNLPKNIIENIRREYGIQKDGTQDDSVGRLSRNLKSAIEQLSIGLYGEDVHFILELIQNAEDNDYESESPDLRFVVLDNDPTNTSNSEGCLCVFNNETGFEEINIDRICQIGQSSKTKKEGYIGEKGIGFKSVFIASSSPHIYSNGYQIKFNENDPLLDLAYIVPYWLEIVPDIVKSDAATTAILLPIKSGKKLEIINGLLRINPETILFLSKLEGLTVEFENKGKIISLVRDRTLFPIVDLLVERDGKHTEISRYFIHSESVAVPKEIQEEKRENIVERIVTVAFPLENFSSNGRIYAFLPTEVDSGFPFLINTDFILTANRESIQPSRSWNIWLRDELSSVIVKGIEQLINDEEHRYKVYGFIPIDDDLKSLKDYFLAVCSSVHKKLSKREVVINELGDLVGPSQVRGATKEIRDLFSGASKPVAFKDFQFMDRKLEKFSKRLSKIGVKSFSHDDLNLCLTDKQWLKKQDSNWFFSLYQMLKNSDKNIKLDLYDLPILPVQDGKRVSSNLCQVFFPMDEGIDIQLGEKHRSGKIPDVYFLDRRLHGHLSNNPELLLWVKNSLGIHDFSISSYISVTLVPWLSNNVGQLSQQDLLDSVSLIIEFWVEIAEEDRKSIGQNLPVLLDDETISTVALLEGNELLIPRAFDKESGWQRFLVEEGDYKHVDVLSDQYIKNFGSNVVVLSEFLRAINAEWYPDLSEVEIKLDDYKKSKYDQYASSIFTNFNEEYTHDDYSKPKIKCWRPPSFFFDKSKRENKKIRKAFILWLEAMIENGGNVLKTGKISWFRYSKKSSDIQSALIYYIQNVAWIKTTQGFRKPGEVFKEKKHIFEMFGNRIAYLSDDIPPQLCEFIGVKTEVTTETVVEYLHELSKRDVTDIKLIKQLYKYLDDYGDGYESGFNKYHLIYIPDSEKRWYTSSEVIWDDASDVLGNLYGWISPVYESNDLRGFFVNKLNISEKVKNEDLAKAWLDLPGRKDMKPVDIESSLTKIYPSLLKEAIAFDDHSDWWGAFIDSVQLWTQDDEFLDRDENYIYVPDDYYLRNLFNQDLPFVWKPVTQTHNELAGLYKELCITPLSEAVNATLENPGELTEVESPIFLTDYSKRLICYLLYNDSAEKYQSHLDSGVLEALLQTVEAKTNSLKIRYSVKDTIVHKIVSDNNAFWEPSRHLLYLSSDAEDDELEDDISEVIARVLWGAIYKKHEDHVRTTLAVSGDKRYKKIRDKKGWHIPPDILKQVNLLIGGSGQQHPVVESRPQDEGGSEVAKEVTSEASTSDGRNITSEGSVNTDGQTGYGSGDDVNQPSGVGNFSGPHSGALSGQDNTGRSGGANRSGGTGGHSGSIHNRSRGGSSRSQGVASSINQARRNQMRSYVANELSDELNNDSDAEANKKAYEARQELGKQGELEVVDDLRAKGYLVKRMPENNKGYDIEAINPETSEILYIEVKGDSFSWSDKGVGISTSQYQFGLEKRDSFYLAVVENLRAAPRNIYYIQNPVSQITQYRFDRGWLGLSSSIKTVGTGVTENTKSIVEKLNELTESDVCKQVIQYCHDNNYPYPDVGVELEDSDGRIIIENIELAWDQEKIGVFINGAEVKEANEVDQSWAFYSVDELDKIYERLDQVFNLDDKCE